MVLQTTQMLDCVGAPDLVNPLFLWAELLLGSE
jgi:hypothetical protein